MEESLYKDSTILENRYLTDSVAEVLFTIIVLFDECCSKLWYQTSCLKQDVEQVLLMLWLILLVPVISEKSMQMEIGGKC
ncbi:hypothetical protein OUZ56_022752 [Daphnia magna]|uniref:Uncharacterized protein n=1 Tax=Daphnia magna TaxID=35525 RepID=A0ABR0AXI1_9CRUS|nr:hypothetical protein OUZ56_022752 [Daphnia magna]